MTSPGIELAARDLFQGTVSEFQRINKGKLKRIVPWLRLLIQELKQIPHEYEHGNFVFCRTDNLKGLGTSEHTKLLENSTDTNDLDLI
jgi:hypothetical protein